MYLGKYFILLACIAASYAGNVTDSVSGIEKPSEADQGNKNVTTREATLGLWRIERRRLGNVIAHSIGKGLGKQVTKPKPTKDGEIVDDKPLDTENRPVRASDMNDIISLLKSQAKASGITIPIPDGKDMDKLSKGN